MDKNELINGYFEGSLSENQSVELERLRTTDPEFAADFEFERELQSALKKEERQQLKTMLSRLGAETIAGQDGQTSDGEAAGSKLGTETVADPETGRPNKKETKVIRLRPLLAAASVALLIGLGAWLLFFNHPDLNNDQLYAANFAPYENVVHPIERGEQSEDLKSRAFTAYEDADYPLALELFEELQAQQVDSYIAFYEGIVLMQLNQHREAIPLLEGYLDDNGQLKDRAQWYLALSYLKLDELEKSKAQLETLVAQQGFKAEAARELLQKMG